MHHFHTLVFLLNLFVASSFLPSVYAQMWTPLLGVDSTAVLRNLWSNSHVLNTSYMSGDSIFRPVLGNSGNGNAGLFVAFGFYGTDGGAFLLSVIFVYFYANPCIPQVIWSANRNNPVYDNATLNFTTEGELVLRNGDGTLVWSTGTKGRSVAGMRLEGSGNLVLFDHKNASVWQSFDHPTDSLVLGQSLCTGMNLTANAFATNWTSGPIYLSITWNGLRLFLDSIPLGAYTDVFQLSTTNNTTSSCYAFVNGSLGFPNQIFLLPLARSVQFMRLESDGHLRLYELRKTVFQMVFDVLSNDMEDCNYPMACGEYGVCSNGQCSCPSSSHFRPLEERHPNAGCAPLTALSCNNMKNHQFVPLGYTSYLSDISFQALATRNAREEACKQSCLKDCSCKVALFQYDGYIPSDSGSCLLLSKLVSLTESSDNRSRAFVKIQGSSSRERRIWISVGAALGGLAILSIVVSVVIWRKCEKVEEEEFFHGIPGIPKRFSLEELTVATENFSRRLGGGGFGSVFEGKIGEDSVAVKRLEGVGQGKEEFLAEVETIGRIHHLYLVRLIGFCAEKSHRLLVYEYMCNGSLDAWIFRKYQAFTLAWDTRRNIIMGIAKGLSYLHEECKQRIAHLDIKPQNILLDDKFNAKLSDFGLSKLINRDQSKVMT